MQLISSRDNRIFKAAAALAEKKYRDRDAAFLAEGPNIVREALSAGSALRAVFVSSERAGGEAAAIAGDAERAGAPVYELTRDLFSRLSDTETTQGITAVVRKRELSEGDFFAAAGGRNVLVLDRVQDPGNAGTLIRTAEAMGFGGVIAVKGSADIYGPKAVRAAAGSILRLPALCAGGGDVLAELLEDRGYRVYAAAAGGELRLCDADLKSGAAVVIGNEGAGVSHELLKRSKVLSIPMEGRTESLNAALAGAMIMYESLRQRMV